MPEAWEEGGSLSTIYPPLDPGVQTARRRGREVVVGHQFLEAPSLHRSSRFGMWSRPSALLTPPVEGSHTCPPRVNAAGKLQHCLSSPHSNCLSQLLLPGNQKNNNLLPPPPPPKHGTVQAVLMPDVIGTIDQENARLQEARYAAATCRHHRHPDLRGSHGPYGPGESRPCTVIAAWQALKTGAGAAPAPRCPQAPSTRR